MYNKDILDNGLTIVSEKIEHVNLVTFGVWINVGSAVEDENIAGISHFIEHMLFKGSKNYSARDIATMIDNFGGQINAFTSKESTCIYVKMLDEHIYTGIDIVLDMLINPLFLQVDIDKERSVIFEEIKMYEDSPDDLSHDILFESIYSNKGIGANILGNKDSIRNIDKKSIETFFKNMYTPKNSAISICGNFDLDKITNHIKKKTKDWVNSDGLKNKDTNQNYNKKIVKLEKQIKQINLCMGLETVNLSGQDSYVLSVINNVFGAGISSRLFQNIREDMGCVYSIYSYPSLYKNCGVLNIACSMSFENFDRVYERIIKEISRIKDDYLTDEEINKSKEQLKGNYILSLESTSSRMMSMGRSQILLSSVKSPNMVLDEINKITRDDVKRVIDKTFDLNKLSVCIVGQNVDDIQI